MMFRRANQRYAQTPEPVTPYQRAAQVWDERLGSARTQAKNWRLMAFGCLTLAVGLAGGLVKVTSESRVTPYVVEVDKLGEVQAVGERTVSIEVTSVVRASPDSFQVKWTEQAFRNGALERTERWTAILSVIIRRPTTADVLRKNPLGLYVLGLDWSRELNPGETP